MISGARRCRAPLRLLLVATLALAPTLPAYAAAEVGAPTVAQLIRKEAGGAFDRFYATRNYRPLWLSDGAIGPQASTLLAYLRSSKLDGLRPTSYDIDGLNDAIRAARGGDRQALAEADLALSRAFVRYVQDQRRVGNVGMTYADRTLKPRKLKADAILRAATLRKSFADYVADMGWMHPLYVRVRSVIARAEKQGVSEEVMARLHRNLDRARVLPSPWTQHVVVDASSGRLWYYQEGAQVGVMRVVVGAQKTQTPLLAGTLHWAIVNPYWNVPDYLVRDSIAKKILSGRTLASMGIEALSDYSANARKLSASEIDWHAVAAGRQEIRLRQLPGGSNSMGRVKFLFPNDMGIYLHDTPDKDLLKKSDRHFSNGCIRLEKAAVLGRWLLQRPIKTTKQPEQAVQLPVGVPVYLTYITADASDAGVIFRPDIYGHDE